MIVAMEHHQRCHAMDAGTGMARSRVGKRKGFEGLSLRSRLRPRHDARVPQIETVTGPQPQPRALRVATTEAERGEADALRQMMAAEERAQAAAMEETHRVSSEPRGEPGSGGRLCKANATQEGAAHC